MGRKTTKDDKRRHCENSKIIKELEKEKTQLEALRDCKHVIDALTIYLAKRTNLTDEEVDEITNILRYLRGSSAQKKYR